MKNEYQVTHHRVDLTNKHRTLINMYYNIELYPTLASIANALNLDVETIKKRIQRLRKNKIIGYDRFNGPKEVKKDPSIYKTKLDEETAKLLSQSKDRLISQLIKERSRTEVVCKACEAAIAKIKIIPAMPKIKHDVTKHNSMHVMISDVHIGQFDDGRLTAGITEYNYNIFLKYMDVLLEKILTFKDLYGSKEPLTKLVINFLGDVVEGETIYPGQAFYIDQYLTDQIFNAIEKFSSFYRELAKEFGIIESFCVWGNHGRAGLKGMNHARTNFDYIFYRSLKTMLKEQQNIKFYISESPFMLVRHGNYTFFLLHGDGIKRYMSLPFYNMDRMARNLPGLFNTMINYILVGHFHRDVAISLPQGKVLANGSFPGGSLLSVSTMFETAISSQKLFIHHDKKGIHSVSDLVLSNVPKFAVGTGGVYNSVK